MDPTHADPHPCTCAPAAPRGRTAEAVEELAQLVLLQHAVDVAHKDGARHELALVVAAWQVRVVDGDDGGLGGADADGEVPQHAAALAQSLQGCSGGRREHETLCGRRHPGSFRWEECRFSNHSQSRPEAQTPPESPGPGPELWLLSCTPPRMRRLIAPRVQR